jgi:hypothetical protein
VTHQRRTDECSNQSELVDWFCTPGKEREAAGLVNFQALSSAACMRGHKIAQNTPNTKAPDT